MRLRFCEESNYSYTCASNVDIDRSIDGFENRFISTSSVIVHHDCYFKRATKYNNHKNNEDKSLLLALSLALFRSLRALRRRRRRRRVSPLSLFSFSLSLSLSLSLSRINNNNELLAHHYSSSSTERNSRLFVASKPLPSGTRFPLSSSASP